MTTQEGLPNLGKVANLAPLPFSPAVECKAFAMIAQWNSA